MARIVVRIQKLGPRKSEVISAVRRLSGTAIAEISAAINEGRPVIDRKLFDRQAPGFPEQLMESLASIGDAGAVYDVFEVVGADPFDQSHTDRYFRLDSNTLRNIIDAHNQSIQEQGLMAELEEG